METTQDRSLGAGVGAAVPLTDVTAGQTVEVARILGGMVTHARMTGMGIISGARVEVLRNHGRSPVLLGVKHARIAIGRSLAEKVLVRRGEPFQKGVMA